MPLWYVPRDGEIWIYTYAKSQKVKNLERDPRATLLVETGHEYGELRGVEIEAEAEIHRDLDTVFEVAKELTVRYCGGRPSVEGDAAEALKAQARKRVAIRFEPRRVATWDHRKLGGDLLGPVPPEAPAPVGLAPILAATMENLKGLILSGGAGTRLRPITHTSAKQLVPVANKPVLFYGIEALVEAGITEIGIVIAPETGDEIAAAAGDGSAFGASITYIHQDEPLGLAHAVLTAEEFLQDGPFVMYLGDNLLRDGITDLVDAFRASRARRPDPAHPGPRPGQLRRRRAGRRAGRSPGREARGTRPATWRWSGVYMFGPPIFEAAKAIEPSGRGELEITDAIQRLIDGGKRVESRTVTGWWKDTGQLDDMLEANRLVLEDIERRIEGELVDSQGRGPGGGRGRRAARARGGPRPGDHRRRTPGSPTPTSAPTRRSTRASRGALRGRALDPARRAPASPTSARAWRRACWAATSSSRAATGCPRPCG